MKKTKKAFTIVETLMTLLAITIMIAGPLTFMYKSYTYSEFVISKAISMGLAQESLELATSLRNNDLNAFKTMISSCTSGCMFDWDGTSAVPTYSICSGDNCKLYKNPGSSEMYKSSGTEETGQYRYLKFTSNGTGGYLAESVAWSYVDSIKVEAKLNKMFFEIQIK